ncbi:MAG: PH domain-containing protein [Verrucomicrobia bacterium]|nr:PH domain-containing protein [Verrucomicrobiota bacterium]
MRKASEVERELNRAGLQRFWEFWWTRKVRLFAESLGDNEHIVAGVRGYFREVRGRLVATEQRLLFVERKGLFGSIVESFPYSRINEISASNDVFRGDLIISSGASTERIRSIWKAHLIAFLHLVQQTLAEFRSGGPTSSTGAANHLDTASQLEKLAALRDRGVLTPQEFQEQKEKLLRQ